MVRTDPRDPSGRLHTYWHGQSSNLEKKSDLVSVRCAPELLISYLTAWQCSVLSVFSVPFKFCTKYLIFAFPCVRI
jgi:hypothetical protein